MSFASLHHAPGPLVLPNAWDAGSARLMCAEGFAAVGTTSMGMSASAGHPDGTRAGSAALAPIIAAIRGAGVYVNVDLEDGSSADPQEVADAVESLDADGVNLEDSTDHALVPPELMAEKITAVRQRRPDLFLNARVDTYFLGHDDLRAFVDRAHAYLASGADGVFLHGTVEPEVIATVAREVPAPLNVLAHPWLTSAQLYDLGVRRISTGSYPYRAAIRAALAAVRAVRDGDARPDATPYDELQHALRPVSR